MAKSKMVQQCTVVLGQCKTAGNAVEKSVDYALECMSKNDDAAAQKALVSVNTGMQAYEAALKKLEQDLGSLDAYLKRWNADTKLKNIFKDKAKLRTSKQAADAFVTQTTADLAALKQTALYVKGAVARVQIG